MASKDFENYSISTWLFIKLLAIIYFIAFLSLSPQIIGLVGEDGILPVGKYLEAAKLQFGEKAYWHIPTLLWFSTNDSILQALCSGGVLLSILFFFRFFPIIIAIILWIFYLSLTVSGQDFLGFQWDNLLLEVGFLTIFLLPISLSLKNHYEPSKVILFLFKLLLFKLMFMSGIVKFLSGDPAWKTLSALTYHYETQPLPNPISFIFHELPEYVHVISCIAMFFIELIVPFFIFYKRNLRLIAGFLFVLFQILIMLTGNYCFFNLLTIGLALFLIDDEIWLKLDKKFKPVKIEKKEKGKKKEGKEKIERKSLVLPRFITIPVATFIVIVSVIQLSGFYRSPLLPKEVVNIFYKVMPFRSINTYGLFAVMTTKRPEIIIEGSVDGITWETYEFKHKPGKLNKRLPFVAPHQPRLDWQMWFAALSPCEENKWFINFCMRLLEKKQDVLKLLEKDPFLYSEPKYIRTSLYDYKFTNTSIKRATGNRWERKYIGQYCKTFVGKD